MATYTPPPYFPQGSLAPPDKRRYLKFKLVMTGVVLLMLAVAVGVGYAVWHLIKWLF